MYSDAFYDSLGDFFIRIWVYDMSLISASTCEDEVMMWCAGGEL